MARRVDKWEAKDGTIWDTYEEAEKYEQDTYIEASFLFAEYEDENYCEECGGVTFDMCVEMVEILKRRFKLVDKNKK